MSLNPLAITAGMRLLGLAQANPEVTAQLAGTLADLLKSASPVVEELQPLIEGLERNPSVESIMTVVAHDAARRALRGMFGSSNTRESQPDIARNIAMSVGRCPHCRASVTGAEVFQITWDDSQD